MATLAGCATTGEGPVEFVRRAWAAAGGQAALSRARVLAWTGDADVHLDGRVVEIAVDTVVVPFVYARSQTWLRGGARSDMRTLEINGPSGVLVRDGVREPMAPALIAHERQQYAVYGLMRLVTLLDPGVEIRFVLPPADAPTSVAQALRVDHPLAPQTVLMFDIDARLVAADNVVSHPEGGAPVSERFRFSGTIEGGGVRWPRRTQIFQDGSLYFDLRLATFSPRNTL